MLVRRINVRARFQKQRNGFEFSRPGGRVQRRQVILTGQVDELGVGGEEFLDSRVSSASAAS